MADAAHPGLVAGWSGWKRGLQMGMERTLAIIKPDAVRAGHIGHILTRIEVSGFRLVAMKLVRMDRGAAEAFYAEHRARSFFPELCEYMSSGPVIVMILESENCIAKWRALIGPTDAAVAPPGTIRGDFGESVQNNAVHGSDIADHARYEINFFFGHEPRHP